MQRKAFLLKKRVIPQEACGLSFKKVPFSEMGICLKRQTRASIGWREVEDLTRPGMKGLFKRVTEDERATDASCCLCSKESSGLDWITISASSRGSVRWEKGVEDKGHRGKGKGESFNLKFGRFFPLYSRETKRIKQNSHAQWNITQPLKRRKSCNLQQNGWTWKTLC